MYIYIYIQAILSTYKVNDFDTLKNIIRAKPITLINKYNELQDDSNDSDDDSDSDSTHEAGTVAAKQKKKLNRRQRKVRQMQAATTTITDYIDRCNGEEDDYQSDEAIRDAVACEGVNETDWCCITTNRRHKVNFDTSTNYTTQTRTITIGSSLEGAQPQARHHCSSQVDCHPDVLHPQSSQCGCQLMSSAGLSVAIAQNSSSLVSRPQEWPPHGVEGREVMSPTEGTPAAELLHNAEIVVDKRLSRQLLQHPRGCPPLLGGNPSKGTWPSEYIPGGARLNVWSR